MWAGEDERFADADATFADDRETGSAPSACRSAMKTVATAMTTDKVGAATTNGLPKQFRDKRLASDGREVRRTLGESGRPVRVAAATD
jgi:hypothetical protein